jgi:nitrite reductase/ring-hydroxylating ferredoxin subunit
LSTLAPIPKAYRDHTEGYAKGWYSVADSDDVTSDAMLPVSYLDQQFVVYRDREGVARVSEAYCPHLGAHLASADGCIDNGEIVCPFHKWRFNTNDGRCASVPYATVVPKRAVLTSYPTIEMGGMVLMWWHPKGGCTEAKPHDALSVHGDRRWLRHSTKNYETQVPVRDLNENIFDTAHIQQLHGSLYMPRIASVERHDFGLEVNFAPSTEAGTSLIEYMQFNFSGVSVVSNTVLGKGFGFIQYSALTPIDRENSVMRNHMFIMDTGSEEMNERVGCAFADRVRIEIEQDLKVLNYKKHLPRPLLCSGDGPVMKWRKYSAELYASSDLRPHGS